MVLYFLVQVNVVLYINFLQLHIVKYYWLLTIGETIPPLY